MSKKSFQAAHQKLYKLDRFKGNKDIFYTRNDLAFKVSEEQH
jgi:hypothetical protein